VPAAEARRAGDDAFGLAVGRLPGFTDAVLAAVDPAGNPTLVRTRPVPDAATRRFTLTVPDGEELSAGPASLLCHGHDDRLWSLRSFVVAGDLTAGTRPGEWTLEPSRYVPGGADRMGPVSMVRTLRDLRRTAQAYLDRRDLPRPVIPWAEYEALG
jgi:hypothetical protein